ncbi:MAG: DPP IV N-terminal domain-containing protein, partial [Bacteroidota bacterium]|nr:DPP IV N-terminal domain-containing protein [Bacteroidota bacterium]
MQKLFLLIGLLVTLFSSQAQEPVMKANYSAAARFSPKKMERMLFSTSVDPHWLKKGDRFWYVYETTNGKNWYLVDAANGTKRKLFDNEKIAAQLSLIVKDPMDAQHLSIDSLRFVKDEEWIQFEVKSTEEIEKKDSTAKKGTPPVKEKKVYYFEYNFTTNQLLELPDFKKPKRNPRWASVSPDGNLIVFGRNFNLYWMDKANYEKALKNEDDSTIVESKLTTDGVEYYGYYNEAGENNVDKEKNKDKRKPAILFWSPDSRHFTMVRT